MIASIVLDGPINGVSFLVCGFPGGDAKFVNRHFEQTADLMVV
jgi:hypothetical protein